MDLENIRNGKQGTMLVKTNLWKVALNSVVFQYKLVEKEGKKWPLTEKFREALISEIGKNTPENLLNKLLDLEEGIFYAVKIFDNISFKLSFSGIDFSFTLVYGGDNVDKFKYLKCLFSNLLYKSQLIQVDEYYINPFDIRETDEVSLFPAFKIEVVKVDQQTYISVTNEMLFSPNIDLCTLISALKERGVGDEQIESIFRGKLIQTKYQSWAKYFKITKLLLGESLNNYQIEKHGTQVPLLDYFKRKYPFLSVTKEQQPLVVAVPVNDRFESIKEQKEKILIPEMLHWIISSEDLLTVHGVDYFRASNVNPQIMKFFYIGKFMTSFIDKQPIKMELFKWKVQIDRSPSTMGFHSLEFNPSLLMISPQGQSRIERNLNDQNPSFYHSVLENRMYSYVPFKEILIAFPRDLVEKAQKIVQEFSDCLTHFKYSDKKPESIVIDLDELDSWKAGLESKLAQPSAGRIILCLTKNFSLECQLRAFLISKNEIFKVRTLGQTENFKYDCFKAHHDIQMLNQLIGGQPWIVKEITEETPIVVGGCIFQQLEGRNYLVTFTFSWNKNFTKYLTKMMLIPDCQEEGAIENLKDFFSKCKKSMLSKLGVDQLEFSSLIYLQIVEKYKLFSSFDREANLADRTLHKENHSRLVEIFKSAIANFGHKSLIAAECIQRPDISLFPAKSSVDSIDKTTVDYYSDFSQFYQSRHNIFGQVPECLHMSFANNNRFLIVSRYKADFVPGGFRTISSPAINEFFIFHTMSVNEDMVKKWVMTNTILYGCVDFENIEAYVCLPVALKLSARAIYKLASLHQSITPELVLSFNKYMGFAQLT